MTANTTADLDGNGPSPAGTKVNIHTNSDALDTTMAHPLNPGDFDQVGNASSSTEIAADGQEADIFYNDGVNWPAGNGSRAHDCFAGYTGWIGGFTSWAAHPVRFDAPVSRRPGFTDPRPSESSIVKA